MELEELRGFTIIDSAPYTIVINSSDDIGARIFTLLHEYGHILLREPALCTPEEPTREKHGAEVEAWCNRFAAAFLLLSEEIIEESCKEKESICNIEITPINFTKFMIGDSYVSLVIENMQEGLITYSDALEYLNIKCNDLEGLVI